MTKQEIKLAKKTLRKLGQKHQYFNMVGYLLICCRNVLSFYYINNKDKTIDIYKVASGGHFSHEKKIKTYIHFLEQVLYDKEYCNYNISKYL